MIAPTSESLKEISFKKKLFGGEIEIVLYNANPATIDGIIKIMYKEALRLEKIFNVYDSASEISLLNIKRKLNVSSELLEVLTKALVVSELTHGKYDITLGKRIMRRKNGLSDIKLRSSYKDVLIDHQTVQLHHEDVMLDLGSIAKGFITDRIGELLRENGIHEFLIDSRGDILISGTINHIIPIQDPRNKDKNVKLISLRDEGVATSGDYNQFYGGYDNSHILNAKEIISVTVVSPTLEEADVYATALFVADKAEREMMLRDNSEIKVLVITSNLKKQAYNNFEEIVYET